MAYNTPKLITLDHRKNTETTGENIGALEERSVVTNIVFILPDMSFHTHEEDLSK